MQQDKELIKTFVLVVLQDVRYAYGKHLQPIAGIFSVNCSGCAWHGMVTLILFHRHFSCLRL